MADFIKVMQESKRMCDYYSLNERCGDCPLNSFGCAPDMDDMDMCLDYQKAVMTWAEKHPYVYPTWNEWIKALGAKDPNERIDEATAKKFGILPVYGFHF